MNWTALSMPQYVEAINSEIAGATNTRRVERLKQNYGSAVKGPTGKLNALGIAPIQWARLREALVKSETPFDRDSHKLEQQIIRREKLRDIGEIPAVSDPVLRAECDASLETFIRTAFPKIFFLEWCEDHYALCRSLQTAVVDGGKRAVAYQRGFGKTQFCIAAIIWGVLTGRLPMVMLISKNDQEAAQIQEGIKRRLETNKTLRALYPEICWVMNKLSRSPGRRYSYRGNPIDVKAGEIFVLPVIEGAPGSEAAIKCCGILAGSLRGSHYDRSDETSVRPKLVLLDDPQDETSAKNSDTIAKISALIKKAVHGLSGPGVRLAVFMPCTCIEPNDLAHQFTDRVKEPEYMGIRQAALDAFPKCIYPDNELGLLNHWDRYLELYREDLAMGDPDFKRATVFYVTNRVEMSQGASVRWASRSEKPFFDALQYLMTKFMADRAAFMAEFQQDPIDSTANVSYLNADEITRLVNGVPRGYVPANAVKVVSAIDIQESVLYWIQVAWAEQFTGFILNWGTWPEQPPGMFAHQSVARKISAEVAAMYPGAAFTWDEEMEIAIRECTRLMLEPLDGGDREVISDAVIADARWHKIEQIVLRVAAEDEFRGRLIPAGGQFVSASRMLLSRSKLAPNEQRADKGLEWKMNIRPGGVYMVEFDADHLRTRVQTGLKKGSAKAKLPGRITYNGDKESKFLAMHLAAKYVTLIEGPRRTAEHWKNRPNQDQDHWLDGLVMCLLGAEHEGMRRTGEMKTRPTKRQVNRQTITQGDVPK